MANKERLVVVLAVVFGGLMIGGCSTQAPSTPLQLTRALENNNLGTIRQILAENPKLVNSIDRGDTSMNMGYTPLHIAVQRSYIRIAKNETRFDSSYLDVAKLLIAKGANVNAPSKSGKGSLGDGRTPLQMAAGLGRKDFAELLIANGADVNLSARYGVTPLCIAARWEGDSGELNRELIELLIANGAAVNPTSKRGCIPLYHAVMGGQKDTVELLVAKGAEVKGKALLPRDMSFGWWRSKFDWDIAEFLVAQGAEVNTKSGDGCTPLHVAAMFGPKEIVKLYLEKGADVNARQEGLRSTKHRTGATPLYWALQRRDKDIDVVELLIEHGADVNGSAEIDSQDLNGSTPLHIACNSGHTEAVELLIAKGADVNAKRVAKWGGQEETPLYMAVRKGHKDIVELLIAAGANVDAAALGMTPLCVAARYKLVDIVELLIANGANVNAQDSRPPLHCLLNGARTVNISTLKLFIDKGADIKNVLHLVANKEAAELLIANGADVNAGRNSGKTPLYHALENGRKEVAELLRKHGAVVGEDLHGSAMEGNLDKVKSTLSNTPELLNSTNKHGMSLRDCAIIGGNRQIIEFLIAKGVDVNERKKNGFTALDLAARVGQEDAAKVLLDNGADVNAKSEHGYTSLHYATSFGLSVDLVKLLIAKGANVNAKNFIGMTPLHNASNYSHKDVLQVLLANGADVNARAMEGNTPLHMAIWRGKIDIIEILIAKGADVNARSKNGNRPLGDALQQADKSIAELLRKHGARL